MLRLQSAIHGILAKLLLDQRLLCRDGADALLDLLEFTAQRAEAASRFRYGRPGRGRGLLLGALRRGVLCGGRPGPNLFKTWGLQHHWWRATIAGPPVLG